MFVSDSSAGVASGTRTTPPDGMTPSDLRCAALRQRPQLEHAAGRGCGVGDRLQRQVAIVARGGRDQRRLRVRPGEHDDDRRRRRRGRPRELGNAERNRDDETRRRKRAPERRAAATTRRAGGGSATGLMSRPSRDVIRAHTRGGGVTAGTRSASTARRRSHSVRAAATTRSCCAIVRQAPAHARRRRAEREFGGQAVEPLAPVGRATGSFGRCADGVQAAAKLLESAADPRFHGAQRLAQMRGEFTVRQAVEERERDRLPRAAVERVDAVAHRSRVGSRQTSISTGVGPSAGNSIAGCIVVAAVEGDGVDLAPALQVEARLRTIDVSQVRGWLLAASYVPA